MARKNKESKKDVEFEMEEDFFEDFEDLSDEALAVAEEAAEIEEIEEPLPPPPKFDFKEAEKTFFDFTYVCVHDNNRHCIECYNKAKGV